MQTGDVPISKQHSEPKSNVCISPLGGSLIKSKTGCIRTVNHGASNRLHWHKSNNARAHPVKIHSVGGGVIFRFHLN